MKLLCPICNRELNKDNKAFKCFNKHNFDISKEGYLNLNHSSQHGGDSKESINARNEFLNNDHYLILKEELIKIINDYHPNNLLDLACGQGYYTKDFPVADKIGIDLSKQALKIASKNDKNTTYLLTSIFQVPLENNSIDLITTIFAPLADKEIYRLLRTNAYFIYVTANEDHLIELKENLYDNVIKNEIKDIQINGLELIKKYNLKENKILKHQDIINLLKMTPYFYRTNKEDIKRVEELKELNISFDFIISIYKKI